MLRIVSASNFFFFFSLEKRKEKYFIVKEYGNKLELNKLYLVVLQLWLTSLIF